ncbi:Transmembrane protein 250 [Triplophysa tibetana]|uniref:Transmembrane protein 250 n=1 Tax=Triplophysa tibetana TaxID=1572043 RepID=A0A5A9P661_9TELE|nr:Transmembrane protein 250 [Triplophysa tibetana]
MPVIPIPRRVRSFHGPHTTCMHSACGPARTAQLVRTKYNNFDLYLKSRWMYSFVRFLLYFGCSLFTSLLWAALSVLFCLQYVSVRIFLRLQYKLSVILLLLGHRRLDFGILNDLFIYSMHITMFLIGGLGWCFMVFVDIVHAAVSQRMTVKHVFALARRHASDDAQQLYLCIVS